jgi:alkylation response protein AidB-like acyl-CoA dehydrogenase
MHMVDLTQEQRVILEAVQDIAENEFDDQAFSYQGELPEENIELLANRGFLGINIDEDYGGGGLTEYEALLMAEVVGRVCPDTGMYLAEQAMVSPRTVAMFGSEAAKEQYLPEITGGEAAMSIAISEPQAGSDINAMETTVEEENGELILNGEKIWVSGAAHYEYAVVWVRFPGEGFGSVVIEFDWDGISIQEHYTNMAGEKQTQFRMEDVTVPEKNVLTRGEEAFKEQMKGLNWERIGTAAIPNMAMLCAFDRALEYVQQREQFGQEIGDFQGIEWKLADMAKQIQASRSLIHRAADDARATDRVADPLQTSIVKLYAAEVAERVVSEALQIHGANGYQQGHPLEYLYRFTRGIRIAGGTDEIMKNTIAKELKGDGLPSIV